MDFVYGDANSPLRSIGDKMSNIKAGDLIRFNYYVCEPLEVLKIIECIRISECRYPSKFDLCFNRCYIDTRIDRFPDMNKFCSYNYIKLTDEERFVYYINGAEGLKEFIKLNK